MFEAQLAQEQKDEEGSDGGKRRRHHHRHSGHSHHRHHERDGDSRFAERHARPRTPAKCFPTCPFLTETRTHVTHVRVRRERDDSERRHRDRHRESGGRRSRDRSRERDGRLWPLSLSHCTRPHSPPPSPSPSPTHACTHSTRPGPIAAAATADRYGIETRGVGAGKGRAAGRGEGATTGAAGGTVHIEGLEACCAACCSRVQACVFHVLHLCAA
jgi:hypothetical protein